MDRNLRLVEAVSPSESPPSGAVSAFICAVFNRPTTPSIAPKSARASTGAVIRHSDPFLANDSVRSGVVMDRVSTFSRSIFNTVLSRRSNVCG